MMKLLLAAWLASTTVAGTPQSAPCLSHAEAADLSVFILPAIVDSAAETCAAALPPAAFLRGEHRAFAEQLRAERASRWPRARAAMSKFGEGELPGEIGDEAIMNITEITFAAMVAKDIKPELCPTVDGLLRALAPLPGENLGIIVASLMELGAAGGDGPRFCARTGP